LAAVEKGRASRVHKHYKHSVDK